MQSEHNTDQQKAIATNDSSLLIVAGAGTGKTYVLVEKIIRLLQNGIPGHTILALTFTNKAADEMRNRVHARFTAGKVPFVGTFHSFCVSLLREFPVEANVPNNFIIFDRDACRRLIKRCMKQEGITDYTPRAMQHAIGRLKTGLAAEDESDTMDTAEHLLPVYTLAMQNEHALDFDDLIIKTVALLQKEMRVREHVRNRYTYILVDEFQDTDTLQNQLVALLKGEKTCIIAVGDTDQTIYSWRGASVHNMLGFTERYAPATTVFLTQNYRSTGNILAAANAIIMKNVFRQEKDLVTARADGSPITLLSAEDEEHEGELIAKEIIRLCNEGAAYSDIAVLFRANFQARALETHMITNRIPYTVLGARFFDRAEIKDLLAYLTLVQNPASQEAFVRASNAPKRGIGARTLERIFNKEEHLLSAGISAKVAALRFDITQVTELAQHHPVAHVLRELVSFLDYKTYLTKTFDNPEDRMYEVREFIVFAERFSHLSGTDGIAQLLAEVALVSDQDTLRTTNKQTVRLMTVHAAKGLEFSHVFITGMEEGLFPFLHDEFATHDPEEERRLCYVAMTRAKDTLSCSFARRRGVFGGYKNMRPSSFLSDIPEHLLTTTPTANSTHHTETGENSAEDIQW